MKAVKTLTYKPLTLLPRLSRKPRAPKRLLKTTSLQDIQVLLPRSETSILALDLETNHTDFSHPDSRIVGIGLADRNGCFYLDWEGLEPDAREYLYSELRRRPVTSFNVLFDGGFLWAAGLGWLNWAMCTFGLFRQLATEGFDDQNWKLETFCRDVLGWEESHKGRMDAALARHGLTKSTMWRLSDLEFEEFAFYCATDAEAHLQAFEVLADAVTALGEPGARLREYHREDFLIEVSLLIEQQLRGILTDVEGLEAYSAQLAAEIAAGLESFMTLPEVVPHTAEYNAAVVAHLAGKEPRQFLADGTTISKNWEKWVSKVEAAKATNYFNPGSTKQLRWLLFDKLGYDPKKWTDGGDKTPSQPSTSKEVLPFFGAPGKVLAGVKKKQKELGYVKSTIAKQRNKVLHLQFKSIGAYTTRLSGGAEND